MINILFIALMQAAAGDPQSVVEESQPQAQEELAEQTEGPAQVEEGEQRRCRREPIVGTRLARRVCTTLSQDRQLEEEARAFTTRAQSQIPLVGN